MALEGIERVIDLTLAYVRTNQSAKWAAVEARYTDPAIGLGDFGTLSIGDPNLTIPALDALFVVADGGRATDDAVYSFSPAYLVEFAVICLGETEELAKRKAFRRLVGLLEMLREMGLTTGLEWGTGGPTTWSYLPTYTRGENEFLTDIRLLVSLERPESFT